MKIIRSGSLPSVRGPEAWFTGTVRIDAPFQATEPAKVGGATVTFEPGARTAWHTHPLGQTLIVTQGAAGCRSGAKRQKRSIRVISRGSPRASNTGTVPARKPR